MRYQILRDIDSVERIREVWNSMLDENNHLDVFQSPEWVIAWYMQYANDQAIFCIVFYEDSGDVIGIVPLAIDESTSSINFAGNPLNDCNNIVVKEGHSYLDILSKVFGIIDSVCNAIKHFIIDCIDPSIAGLSDADFKRSGNNVCIENDDISVFLQLPSSYQEYLDIISSKKLKKFAYYERRLFKNDGVEFSRLSSDSDIDKFITWFKKNKIISLKFSGQYDQILDQLKEDTFYSFLQIMIKGLLKKKQVIISYIKIKDQIIAGGVYFVFHKKIMKYIQSWDYEYRIYNPGTVLDWLMIRSAIEDNCVIFDFGRGEEEYKYDFGGENKRLLRVIINRE